MEGLGTRDQCVWGHIRKSCCLHIETVTKDIVAWDEEQVLAGPERKVRMRAGESDMLGGAPKYAGLRTRAVPGTRSGAHEGTGLRQWAKVEGKNTPQPCVVSWTLKALGG